MWTFACCANPSCFQCLVQRLPGALTLQFYGEYHVKIIAGHFHRNDKQKIISLHINRELFKKIVLHTQEQKIVLGNTTQCFPSCA